MKPSHSELEKGDISGRAGCRRSKSLRYVLYGILLCVLAIACVSYFLPPACWFSLLGQGKSEQCADFCRNLDTGLQGGLERLLRGEPRAVVALENTLKADVIVLCRSYSDVSYSKLVRFGIADRTAKKIDVPHLLEGAHFYLLRDNDILCQGHTLYADLVSDEIIAEIQENITLTVVPDPNSFAFRELVPTDTPLSLDSFHHTMLITAVE